MQLSVTAGNAADDGASFNGWFVGDLPGWLRARGLENAGLEEAAGLRTSDHLEVKWGIHPAGLPRPDGWVASSGITTLSVLISGEFEIRFRQKLSHALRRSGKADVGVVDLRGDDA